MRKHRLGKQLLIVLCVVLIVFLAGCRPSPVLEQIIYEQQHEIDEDVDTQTMDDDLDNEEPDEDIPPRETEDDSEQEKDQEYTAALAGDMDTDPDTPLDAVYDVVYSPNGELSASAKTNPTEDSTSEKATGSTEAGGEEGGEVPSGEGEDAGNDGASADESDGGMDAGEEPTGGGNGDLDDGGGQDSGTGVEPTTKERVMKQYVTPSGQEWTVPESVDTVAAVGEVATIVEMLGGSGRLLGSSSSFTGNSFAQQAFASQGISEVQTWWDGDGSSTISDGNFQALLAANPDVCFEISGQDTFSEAQIATLTENNIGYVALPSLNTIANIESAVTIVGQVLGNRESEGFTNAESIALSYCSWADSTIDRATGVYSKKATTYIGRWDPDAYWTIQSPQGRGEFATGYGAPVGMAYNGVSPLAECMGYAGVINMASDNFYVEPLYRLNWEPTITGGSAKYRDYLNIIYSADVGSGLGTENYPAVIVADSTIRDTIYSAEGGNYYSYHWQAGNMINYNGSTVYGVPAVWNGSETFLPTRIQPDIAYGIWVNPSGVGDWANGSVESPLEAAWLACKFQGSISMDEMRSLVSDFYSTFYHAGVDTSSVLKE